MQSLAAALELREKVSPADIPFTADLLGDVDSETLTQLVNQWTLGWGSDAAKVLVMGCGAAKVPPPGPDQLLPSYRAFRFFGAAIADHAGST